MSFDELERPIGQHRKRDEETSKQHPKPVWMSIGVAVTIKDGLKDQSDAFLRITC